MMKRLLLALLLTVQSVPLIRAGGPSEDAVRAAVAVDVSHAQKSDDLVLNSTSDTTNDTPTSVASAVDADDALSLPIKVVEWVRQQGGFFHQGQEFRRISDDNIGVFASQTIEKGEILATIPWKCVVTADTDTFESEMFCNTTHLLIDEMHKGDDSFYAPYINYLQAAPLLLTPSTYSEEGKALFKTIVGKKQLPPKRATLWIDKYWKQECTDGKSDEEDPLAIKAAMQLVSRGDDDTLTPIYDMYNHGNGKLQNAKSLFKRGKDHVIKASRTIQAGDEICLSYNLCKDCGNRLLTYGTPELFREYGFVESYPQRWIFHHEYIAFDIHRKKKSGELYVTWLDDDVSQELDDLYEVSEWGMDILEAHLHRLQGLNKTVLQPLLKDNERSLPQQELDSIVSYYTALTQALDLAVEAAKHYKYILTNEQMSKKKKKKDKKKKTPKKKKDPYAPLLPQDVPSGELALLKWQDTNSVIDPYAAQVGLPPTLVPTIKAYANKLGIFDIVKDFLYNDPCEPHRGRFYWIKNPFAQEETLEFPSLFRQDKEMQWYTQRPGGEWHSDMHWFAPSNERSHEITIRMLKEGGFDQVLEAIGTHYNMDALAIQSAGFLAVTHCEEGYLHTDFKHVEGKVFNFLIPLHSPEGAGPELRLVGKRSKPNATDPEHDKKVQVETEVKYDERYGVLVGDGTWHGTRECDHRPTGDIRIVLSVYLVDLTENNLERVAYDDTAIFPIPGMDDWLWAQRGRHWMKDACTVGDLGRREFRAVDESDECAELAAQGKCETKPKSTRRKCPKSCGIFMDDWDYLPGVERREVIGDIGLTV